MIAVVDYGVGNLFSLCRSLERVGLAAQVTQDPACILAAERVILPGVGAFGDAMAKLAHTGLIPLIVEQARLGKPLLGICLGMQLLFQRSYEYGEHAGLGLLEGEIRPLSAVAGALKVPQMGWNSLRLCRPDDPLLRDVKDGDYVYYVHSYYACNCGGSLVAVSAYGVDVPGVVHEGSVYGTQFHPEKSGTVGLSILKAFGEV